MMSTKTNGRGHNANDDKGLWIKRLPIGVVSLLALFIAATIYKLPGLQSQLTDRFPFNTVIQSRDHRSLHTRSYFYVGGQYHSIDGNPESSIMSGQMYVEHLTPQKVTKPYPIVIIPGSGKVTNFLQTPDGRPGWADYFLSQGYEIYILDLPSRGRSAWQTTIDGPQFSFDTLIVERLFTATRRFNSWSQASLHTQWPGNGSKGDPVFDAFYASTMPCLASGVELSEKTQRAGAELLDKINKPSILLTHSQSGQFGWLIADARPSHIKAIIALEPSGPPFINVVFPPYNTIARPYGLTEIPMTFLPPLTADFKLETVNTSISDEFTCIQQSKPPRKWVNLLDIPVLVVTSQTGYHAMYDVCSVEFLGDAGVSVEHVKLEDEGIFGNGHMMFMEKNSLDIVDRVVNKWLSSKLK